MSFISSASAFVDNYVDEHHNEYYHLYYSNGASIYLVPRLY